MRERRAVENDLIVVGVVPGSRPPGEVLDIGVARAVGLLLPASGRHIVYPLAHRSGDRRIDEGYPWPLGDAGCDHAAAGAIRGGDRHGRHHFVTADGSRTPVNFSQAARSESWTVASDAAG